jgi:hypothetical protein
VFGAIIFETACFAEAGSAGIFVLFFQFICWAISITKETMATPAPPNLSG